MKPRILFLSFMSVICFFVFGLNEVHASEQKLNIKSKNERVTDGDLITRTYWTSNGHEHYDLYKFENHLVGEKVNRIRVYANIELTKAKISIGLFENKKYNVIYTAVAGETGRIDGIYYKDFYLDYEITDVSYSVLISGVSEINEAELYSGENDVIAPNKISNVQYVFNEDNSITYTFDFPTDTDFSHLEIYQGASLLNEKFTNNSIKITDLVPLMNYTFKFISVDKSGNKSDPYQSIITMPEGPDLTSPLDVTNLKHVVSDSSVQFTYSLPIDDDFSHLQIYRGNDLIADNVKIASFTDENLDFETSYKYIFKSVDFTGNISNGSILTIKTMPYNDEIAPSAPSGLVVNAGNSSLYFNWLGNPENDLAGYNVYVDGVKKNGALINSVSYRLTNLINNQEYTIQVSAVDTSGNESALSDFVVGVPDVSKLPIFKVDNDLKPVAESVESWFSALWLPIAFSSGITLAFIIGRRIKGLFFA